MSEETKKQETMEDFMEEINASFSNFRDDDMLIWDKLVQMQEDKTEFEVTVEGIVKGGVIAYVEGIRAFIPVSKLALHYVENPEDYLKKTLMVRVFEADEQENRLILSAKEILKEKADAEKLDKIPDILKDDGYPDVQAFMKTYRKAEAIVTQYNQDLAEWEQAVKNGQKPAEKQHRPPERQSVRNRLRQLQEEGKQNSQPKQRKKSQDRDR